MDDVILESVRNVADTTYPYERLTGLRTALMCFCGAFMGRQDCIWVVDANMQATAVDSEIQHVDVMEKAYPDSWEFVTADVYRYAGERYAAGDTFDLVSLDPYTNQFDEVASMCALWCGLADKLVIFGTAKRTEINPPHGWVEADRVFRSGKNGGSYWAILEPA